MKMGLVFRDWRPSDSIIQKEKSKELTARNLNFLHSLGFKVKREEEHRRKRRRKNAGNRFES